MRLTFLLLMVSWGLASSSLAQSEELKVAVAANLLPPMTQIEALFEEEFQSEITLIVASSGKLTAQIINGAPYDIFISADMKYPKKIYDEAQAQQRPVVLVQGKLVFWTSNMGDLPIEECLAAATSIAIAQPELAPYGSQTRQWLTKKGQWDKIESKIVYAENVSQVNQYIATDAVDAAFTSNSSLHLEELNGKGRWLKVPGTKPLPHGMVWLRNAEASEFAINQFLEFIVSPVAQQVFQNFDYELP